MSIYSSDAIQAGKEKPKPLITIKFKDEVSTRVGAGTHHIYVKPKDGIEVLVAEKLTIKPGQTHELKLGDLLGVVDVFQKDDFPKVDRIVLTAQPRLSLAA